MSNKANVMGYRNGKFSDFDNTHHHYFASRRYD
jgi:hypothetical protein